MDFLELAREKKGFDFSEAFKKAIAEKVAARKEELKPQVAREMFGEEVKPLLEKKCDKKLKEEDEEKDDESDDEDDSDEDSDDEDDELEESANSDIKKLATQAGIKNFRGNYVPKTADQEDKVKKFIDAIEKAGYKKGAKSVADSYTFEWTKGGSSVRISYRYGPKGLISIIDSE
jgi:hypothetical protein